MNQRENLLSDGLSINQTGFDALAESAKWGRFLGIIGFIFSGLIAFTAFGMLLFMTRSVDGELPGTSPDLAMLGKFGTAGLGIFYFILAGIGFLLSFQCYRFSKKINTGLEQQNSLELNAGLYHLRQLFRIYGIIVVIYLTIVLLAIVGTMIGLGMKS